MKDLFSNSTFWFYSVLALSSLCLFLPKVNVVFKLVNTFVHETGHALIALVSSGEVCKITLNKNTSGQAITASKYWLCKVLTSMAGYTVCALSAYGLLYLISRNNYWLGLLVFVILAVVNLIFWVRNTFGIVWLIVFILLNGALLYFRIGWLNQYVTLFFAFILLIQNISSCITLLKLSVQTPKQSGDANNLADYTYIPAVVWALGFCIFSGYFGYLSVIHFFPNILK